MLLGAEVTNQFFNQILLDCTRENTLLQRMRNIVHHLK